MAVAVARLSGSGVAVAAALLGSSSSGGPEDAHAASTLTKAMNAAAKTAATRKPRLAVCGWRRIPGSLGRPGRGVIERQRLTHEEGASRSYSSGADDCEHRVLE